MERSDKIAFAQGKTASIVGVILLFVLALTMHAAFSKLNLDQYGDMVENYAWGALWQWGTYKHPPFFGWTTAAWFAVFPHENWAYFLFSAVNCGLTFAAVWRIAARFGDGNVQLMAVICAMLMPPLSFLAIKYNANSAMTPIWAWLFVFYLRGLEGRRIVDAVMIGLLATAAMLTKYHSGVVLLALFLHASFDKQARAALLSTFGLTVLVVFFVTIAGHVLWLFEHDFLPIVYAAEQGDGEWLHIFTKALKFVVGVPLYTIGALLVALLVRHDKSEKGPAFQPANIARLRDSVQGRALLAFSILPFILTIILGFAAQAELSAVWVLPIFTPIAVLIALLVPQQWLQRNIGRAVTVAVIYLLGMSASGPVIAMVDRNYGEFESFRNVPLEAVSDRIDELWLAESGGAKGFYVAGSRGLADGTSFYSRYAPLIVDGNSAEYAKGYLTPELARQKGLVLVCFKGESKCTDASTKLVGPLPAPQDLQVTGINGKGSWDIQIWLIKPQN
ncbi:hypothetical protein HGO37_06225 [Rhizobium sp. CG4]|uniref:glycosyltransferase family 39 protein n=1 Tax=Rhizobium sp. CG4 TaxID=2726075 RepID=UPI002033A76C|nr:glycosyltransferase family 39 protein [Rhizobium sp. CG4]MCM2454980.1 hypothetical protein [Rhizobium sp. CG4]